jgi:hypothetical protein
VRKQRLGHQDITFKGSRVETRRFQAEEEEEMREKEREKQRERLQGQLAFNLYSP